MATRDKQIWLIEFGWHTDPVNPTFAWYRVTEEEKGDYIVRAYRLAHERWAPWIGRDDALDHAGPALDAAAGTVLLGSPGSRRHRAGLVSPAGRGIPQRNTARR